MNPPTCPSCSAPLDPLSTKCVYCNAVTPRGRLEAERAEQEARARAAQAAHYAAAQASMAQAAAAQDVSRNATRALIVSLAGLVTCCFPAGWVAAFLAWRALSVAKQSNVPRPASAYAALVLSGLGSVLFVTFMLIGHFESKAKDERLAALDAKSEAPRKRAELDRATACDLAHAFLLRESVDGKHVASDAELKCAGAFEAKDGVGRLDGVSVRTGAGDSYEYRACFARGAARWYVLDMAKAGDCADEPPPKVATEGDEKAARDGFAKSGAARKVRALERRLVGARTAVARASLTGERSCPEAVLAEADRNKGPVRAVDHALLDGKATAELSFLSDPKVARFVSKPSDEGERARLAEELSAPLLVVYRAASAPVLPEVLDKGPPGELGLTPGAYEGALYVVDLAKGEVVCQGPLAWKTPTKPAPFPLARSKTTRSAAQRRAQTDFEERFHDAASERARALGGGRIKLGYKPLE